MSPWLLLKEMGVVEHTCHLPLCMGASVNRLTRSCFVLVSPPLIGGLRPISFHFYFIPFNTLQVELFLELGNSNFCDYVMSPAPGPRPLLDLTKFYEPLSSLLRPRFKSSLFERFSKLLSSTCRKLVPCTSRYS